MSDKIIANLFGPSGLDFRSVAITAAIGVDAPMRRRRKVANLSFFLSFARES
jgi:hypothetical protein